MVMARTDQQVYVCRVLGRQELIECGVVSSRLGPPLIKRPAESRTIAIRISQCSFCLWLEKIDHEVCATLHRSVCSFGLVDNRVGCIQSA